MSGQLDIIPNPEINIPEYIFEIGSFKRTDAFRAATEEEQQAILQLEQNVNDIQAGQQQAINDRQIIKARLQEEGQLAALQGEAENGGLQVPTGQSTQRQSGNRA